MKRILYTEWEKKEHMFTSKHAMRALYSRIFFREDHLDYEKPYFQRIRGAK